MLASGEPDFPFCLCWANENWTRRWDGEDHLVLMRMEYSEEDDRAHIRDLMRFFRSERYIKVDGKPLFLVYRTENLPDPARTAQVWREEARRAGLGELYLVRVESIGKCDPESIGFDAALEFAPDWLNKGPRLDSFPSEQEVLPQQRQLYHKVFTDNFVTTYDGMVETMLAKPVPLYKWMRCVTPSWDNTARRKEGAYVALGATPEKYREWLAKTVEDAKHRLSGDERIVFINAWNEWAEGNHLEPDLRHGRAYLEATRDALLRGKHLVDLSADEEALVQTAEDADATREHGDLLRELAQQRRLIAHLRRRLKEAERRRAEAVEIRVARFKQVFYALNAQQSGFAWQIAKPLRWIETRWPRVARAAMAGPQIAWWTVSMQLPQRMRLRQEAKEIEASGLFDMDWYVDSYPETVLSGYRPIFHWMLAGWREHLDPNPYFSTAWYLQQNPDCASSGENPLLHYMRTGASDGRDPHPLFDTARYLEEHPEAVSSGLTPLGHFLRSHPAP
jgi:hypothetical protein